MVKIKAADWVDKLSYYHKHITFNDNQINCNNYYVYVFVFGKNIIVGCYKFTVSINQMSNFIAIGVTDQSLRNKYNIYYSNGDIYF